MTPLRWRAFWLLLAMCTTALATIWVKPTIRLADQVVKINLEQMIPRQFGHWVMDERQSALVVNPQGEDLVSKLYQQVLSRTYLNVRQGQAIMLSIAYGENQSHSNDLHVPDVCYAAGGFQIDQAMRGELTIRQGTIPVKRLVTRLNQRQEPLTYWAIVGEHVASGAVGPKLVALAYGLQGKIPDGLIFRVSSVGADNAIAFAAQQAFVQDLFDALSSQDRKRLAGLL
jgi:EpsI family protein